MTEILRSCTARLRLELARWRQTEAQMAAMRESGIDPAPTLNQYTLGCPPVAMSLRWPEPETDLAEVRFSVDHGPGPRVHLRLWGEAWPGCGVRLSGTVLLAVLAEHWEAIACGYTPEMAWGDGPAPVIPVLALDWAGRLGRPDLPQFVLHASPREIAITSGAHTRRFGAESLIVVECLKALGDLLAAHVCALGDEGGRSAAAAWAAVRDRADVWPCPLDGVPEGTVLPDTTAAEAAFYARKLGYDAAAFRRAAVWLHARQALCAAGMHLGEPDGEEWAAACRARPATLPDEAEVDRLAQAAAATVAVAVEDFAASALRDFTIAARGHLFFTGWHRRNGGGGRAE